MRRFFLIDFNFILIPSKFCVFTCGATQMIRILRNVIFFFKSKDPLPFYHRKLWAQLILLL